MRAFDPAVLDGIGAVINVGGLSNDPTAEFNPKLNREVNTDASIAIAEACKAAGIQRHVFASSCSIYDMDDGRDDLGLWTEDDFVDPRAAYSQSKYHAERGILALAGPDFCPVILRKGTICGFSPRMRYDLVLNAFVKDGLSEAKLHVFNGGETWRPILSIGSAARAYAAVLRSAPSDVCGQVFNLAGSNHRVSEMALRAQRAFVEAGEPRPDLIVDYGLRPSRSYAVSTEKIERILGWTPGFVSVEAEIAGMISDVQRWQYIDFGNPIYYNIRWMEQMERAKAAKEPVG
jgi:nucleoside-diphosphate-sugar epimerase